MNKLKVLWFGLPILGWIACHWVWIETGKHMGENFPVADALWWGFTSVFVWFVTVALFFLALSLQD